MLAIYIWVNLPPKNNFLIMPSKNEYKSLIKSGEYFVEFKTLFALESED